MIQSIWYRDISEMMPVGIALIGSLNYLLELRLSPQLKKLAQPLRVFESLREVWRSYDNWHIYQILKCTNRL